MQTKGRDFFTTSGIGMIDIAKWLANILTGNPTNIKSDAKLFAELKKQIESIHPSISLKVVDEHEVNLLVKTRRVLSEDELKTFQFDKYSSSTDRDIIAVIDIPNIGLKGALDLTTVINTRFHDFFVAMPSFEKEGTVTFTLCNCRNVFVEEVKGLMAQKENLAAIINSFAKENEIGTTTPEDFARIQEAMADKPKVSPQGKQITR